MIRSNDSLRIMLKSFPANGLGGIAMMAEEMLPSGLGDSQAFFFMAQIVGDFVAQGLRDQAL